MPSTTAGYAKFCKTTSLEPKTLDLDTKNGKAIAHWIGDPDADTIMLYCHGGGYTLPASNGLFQMLDGLVKDMNDDKKPRFAILMLAYTLTPEAVYPTQLREATIVLDHLINRAGRSPSHILLGGDSAGGNLVLALLSHLQHPHADVFPVKLDGPLSGIYLNSPWVGFCTNDPSYSSNAHLDILSPVAIRRWVAMFLNQADTSNPEADPGPISGDAWTEACLNPASWWKNIDQVVSHVFIWQGSAEMLIDSIREFDRNFKEGWADGGGDISRVVVIETLGGLHTQPVMDVVLGRGKKSDALMAIDEWFRDRLQR